MNVAFQIEFYRILSSANNNNNEKVKLILIYSRYLQLKLSFHSLYILFSHVNICVYTLGISFGISRIQNMKCARKQSKKSIFF